MNLKYCLFLLLLYTTVILNSVQAQQPYYPPSPDAISLQDIKVLTLYRGKYTTARRSDPVLQLSCVGGTAAGRYEPDVMQCTNMGFDGTDFQWKCDAELPDDYRLGRITVTCEGYNSPQDPYVLKGSCGVEYVLEFTEKGRKKAYERGDYNYVNTSNTDIGTIFSWIIVLIIIIVICSACCSRNRSDNTSRSYPGGYGGGGYDGGPNYPSHPPNYPPSYPSYPPPSYDGDYKYTNPSTPATGFWTGAATGGMLGYLLGNRNSRSSGSSYRYSSSSSPSSSSSSSRTSSGFGGTKRR